MVEDETALVVAAWTIQAPPRVATRLAGPARGEEPTLDPHDGASDSGALRRSSPRPTGCEAEATEGRECVAFRGFSPDGGCMDHTDPPPCRYALHRARLAVRMAHTAGQPPTFEPATAGRCDGPVRGQLVVRRRPLRAGSALLFEVSALMVAAWTIPTPLRADTTSTGPAWRCAWRLRPGSPPRWSQRQRGVAMVQS